jgi:transcriptional antiterminator NusG
MSRRWYVATTYSGFENSVKQDLERRMESMNMTHLIYQVLVPEETIEVVNKKGEKKEKVQKRFPGYVFIEMEVEKEMDENAWFMVRNTPKVTGFLGSSGGGTKPVPVPRDEMDEILRTLGMITKPKFELNVGEFAQIIDGSFLGMKGEISQINEDKEIVTVLVEMFGRPTPMEFKFNQVKKAYN